MDELKLIKALFYNIVGVFICHMESTTKGFKKMSSNDIGMNH